ncbi:MAG: HEPN domain-containing protein [Chitinophagaceae bacterium]|nr:MAG: HEPN domain-containing protein [Chitinophagaceae bacterium]
MENLIESSLAKNSLFENREIPSELSSIAWTIPREKESSQIPPGLKEACRMIIKLICPEKIFLLGSYENEQDKRMFYDLLIIITGSANRPYNEYNVIIEHIGMKVYPVTGTFVKTNDLHKRMAAGHIYFSRVCRSENLLYDDGAHQLPVPDTIPVDDIIARSEKDFNNGLQRAKFFLEGANLYSERKEKELAAFMLHQAAELTYRAISKSLTDHELFSHDLSSLRRECRRCAPCIAQIFPGNSEEEKRLLSLLQKAYVNTRYKDNYEISECDLTTLLRRIERLHLAVRNIFSVKIAEAAKELSQL